ncbi:hypothetical protein [Enterobacter hormaechei]|uniref:hypothetical protein n=1 Tax=Enterobacter hormaechei TaxID=158836 RepID=UPI000791F972|nr:hypothetical protein [Enterobacter hormaechei]SAE10441.1 Uncharacterised protein [Enterobacter hormaechei]
MSLSNGTIAKSISILSPIAMVLALSAGITSLNTEIKDKPNLMNIVMSIPFSDKTKEEPLAKEINMYRDEVVQLRNTLAALKNTSTLTPENVRIEVLESKVTEIEKKVNALNDILGSNPEKAMALPLMRKDLDSLNTSLKVVSDYSDKQLERFINLFYWIIGVLAGGIISIAAGLYFGLKKNNEPSGLK